MIPGISEAITKILINATDSEICEKFRLEKVDSDQKERFFGKNSAKKVNENEFCVKITEILKNKFKKCFL